MSTDRLTEVLEDWEAVIGLEIHTEVTSSNTKMFCGCPVEFGGEPNSRVSILDLGLPGVLPVLNHEAVRQVAMIESTVVAVMTISKEKPATTHYTRAQATTSSTVTTAMICSSVVGETMS